MDASQRQEEADGIFWFHSIDLGHGLVTDGIKNPESLVRELQSLQLPHLEGKSVLDIGAWDGFYSFECEKRGAEPVKALDHFVWCLDLPKQQSYWKDCREQGIAPQPYESIPELWNPNDLPGQGGFNLAKRTLGSRVEAIVADFMEMDLCRLGQFDVALYLGVLYHMKDPLRALQRLASVTRDLAVIETEAIRIPNCEGYALWEFYETSELNGDISNWWAPTEAGLVGACRAAGFSEVRVLTPAPDENAHDLFDSRSSSDESQVHPIHYRLVAHAYK